MKKITEIFFIFFAKIYIHFFKDRNDYWSLFPPLILASIVTINLQTLSYYLSIKLSGYYYAGTAVFFIIFFTSLFRSAKYDYVKSYKMSTNTKIILSSIILIDLIVNFILANNLRNGEFTW